MSKQNAPLAVIAMLVVSGCGGGGGGGGSTTPPPVGSAPIVTPAPVPNPVNPPAPAPAPAPPVAEPAPPTAPVPPPAPPVVVVPPIAPAPLPVLPPAVPAPTPPLQSEPLPSLGAPQAGSTAAVGTAAEGLWVSTSPIKGLAFVDDQNRYFGYQDGRPGNITMTWSGTWLLTGSSWTFAGGDILGLEHPVRMGLPLEGNGTLNARSSFTGAFGTMGNLNEKMAYEYSAANALAVAPGDLVGTWSSPNRTLTIAADGTVSGLITHPSIGGCAVTGKVVPVYPGTAKNLFNLTLRGSAAPNTSCDMTGTGEHSAKAAITFTDTSQTAIPFYRRSLTILGVVVGGWYAGELVKE